MLNSFMSDFSIHMNFTNDIKLSINRLYIIYLLWGHGGPVVEYKDLK